MDEASFRSAVRDLLFDAVRVRSGLTSDHNWTDEAAAHAVERLARDWPYHPGPTTRESLLAEVHHQLSKTDNPLLRALDPERLTESLMQLEDH